MCWRPILFYPVLSAHSSPSPLPSCPLYPAPLSCARYELGIHGSVADTIADPTRAAGFSWRYRVRTMAGLASSLNYLHRSHSPPIYHRDVKSANVVLVRLARAHATDARRSWLAGGTRNAESR
jgi:serine/threonine protein kinase